MRQELNNNSQISKIDRIQEMLRIQSDDCFLLHALGLEYIKIAEYEKAILQFEKILTVNDEYVGTYYHLAKTFERINEVEKAIRIYRKGIEMAEKVKDKHAKNELIMALDELED